MPTHFPFVPVTLLSIFFTTVSAGGGEMVRPIAAATQPSPTEPQAFAVIELFTSEGCSSCPPADTLLGKLVDGARERKLPIYALSFHVDYWDSLGWADRFSSPEFSRRQRAYAAAFATDDVYTPQMLVNGHVGFVGSDATEAGKQIRAALARPARVSVAVTAGAVTGGKASLDYTIAGSAAGNEIHFALVERKATSEVKRGENEGRELSHANVVRLFVTRPVAKQAGHLDMVLPDDLKPANASVIAYVQNPKSREVVGAAAIDLSAGV